MSDFVALNPSSIHREIRNTLFGDVPLAELVRAHPKVPLTEPWASFQRARDMKDTGDEQGAREAVRKILVMPELDTRVCLQAWHTLRELGDHAPQGREKEVLGVVVEIGMPKGLDLVAAYQDHRARYFNYSGAGVLWERRDDSLDGLIDELLRGTADCCGRGNWAVDKTEAARAEERRCAHQPAYTQREFTWGTVLFRCRNQDPMGGLILSAAFGLMKRLVELTKREPE